VVFDCRGVGLSERLGTPFNADSAVSDVLTILDHAGISQAWLFGSSEGGPVALRLAAEHPHRVRGLMLFGAMAKGSAAPDYPWALDPPAFDTWMGRMLAHWGGPSDLGLFAPGEESNLQMRSWWARMLRHATTPGSMRNTLAALRDVDVRHQLASIDCPVLVMHRVGDRAVRYEAGEFLAANIAGARLVPLDGADHWWWCGDVD
jgi:pimeloyl-ACP methyl ester carboxylesterase